MGASPEHKPQYPHRQAEVCRAHRTPRRVTHCRCGSQREINCLFSLFSALTMMLSAPSAVWKPLISISFSRPPHTPIVHPKAHQHFRRAQPRWGRLHLAESYVVILAVTTKSQAHCGTSYNFVPGSSAQKLLFFQSKRVAKKNDRQHPLHICYI